MNALVVLAARHRVVARLDAAHDQMADTIRRMSYPELAELAHQEGCAQPASYPQITVSDSK